MTIWQALLAHELAGVLERCPTAAERLRIVEVMRLDAIARLAAAAARIPRVPERIAALYRAQGRAVPDWNLDDDDAAIEFSLTLPAHNPSAVEARAAGVLRACVHARELGDVQTLADQQLGAARREKQRQLGTVGKLDERQQQALADEYEQSRGKRGAVKALARKYGVSERTVRRSSKPQ